MRLSCIVAILLTIMPMSARPATADLPILLSVRADLGDIHVERMHLEVGILGVYAFEKLRPNIQITLAEELPCANPLEPCGASRTVSRTYDEVDRLIIALNEAQEHLGRGAPYRTEIEMTPKPCGSSDTFRGTVAVDPIGRTIQFTLESSNAISLNADQAAGFLALLNQANAILTYLKPKFDAFDGAPVEKSLVSPLERSAYRQPREDAFLPSDTP